MTRKEENEAPISQQIFKPPLPPKDPILISFSTLIVVETIVNLPAIDNTNLDAELDGELDLSFMKDIKKGLTTIHVTLDQPTTSTSDLWTNNPPDQEKDQTDKQA